MKWKEEDSELAEGRKYIILSRFSGDFEGLHEAEGRKEDPIPLSRTVSNILGKGARRIETKRDAPFWYRLDGEIEGVLENLAHLRGSYPELFKEADRFHPDGGYSLSIMVLPAEPEDLRSAGHAELVERFSALFDKLDLPLSTTDGGLTPNMYVTRDVMRHLLKSDTKGAFVPAGVWALTPSGNADEQSSPIVRYELFRIVPSLKELVAAAQSAYVRQSDIGEPFDGIATQLSGVGIKYQIPGDSDAAATAYALEHLSGTGEDDDPAELIETRSNCLAESSSEEIKEQIKKDARKLGESLRGFSKIRRRGRHHPKFWFGWQKKLNKLVQKLDL